MSRIAVIGASGRTGGLIAGRLLAAGHQVVAIIRDPKRMAGLVKRGAEVALVDLDRSPLADLALALKGADAVVFAAGSATGESSAIDRKGTQRSLRAAKKAAVKRFVSISAIGASTGMSTRGLSDEMKDYYRAKRAGGKAIMASGLDWTILEPGELTSGKGTGKVRISRKAIDEGKISRDDVAAVAVAVLDAPRSIGHALQLVAGGTGIKAALAAALR